MIITALWAVSKKSLPAIITYTLINQSLHFQNHYFITECTIKLYIQKKFKDSHKGCH